MVALTTGLLSAPASEARAVDDSEPSTSRPSVDYTARGPYGVKRLPKLEHTCVSCFPRCVGDACLLSIDAYVPTPPPVLPDAMFPLVGAVSGDGDVPGDVPVLDAGHGAEWLVGRLTALPPVAEEADGRRARVATLLRRLRERQAGKEVADQGDGSGTRDAR